MYGKSMAHFLFLRLAVAIIAINVALYLCSLPEPLRPAHVLDILPCF